MITTSICKKCRKAGEKLMLKGDRCITPKCAFVKRAYIPGQHGPTSRIKTSEYGRQLKEKQKIKAIYGISESQLVKYYRLADKKEGDTTKNLLSILERRIDNVIFRAGFAPSRRAARQLVSHRHVSINGRKISIPSLLVKPKDKIQNKDVYDSKDRKISSPKWMKTNITKNTIEILHLPQREEMEINVNESLVAEYYSR